MAVTTLKITKSNRIKDLWSNLPNEQGNIDTADYRAIPLGAGEGVYTIPYRFLKGL